MFQLGGKVLNEVDPLIQVRVNMDDEDRQENKVGVGNLQHPQVENTRPACGRSAAIHRNQLRRGCRVGDISTADAVDMGRKAGTPNRCGEESTAGKYTMHPGARKVHVDCIRGYGLWGGNQNVRFHLAISHTICDGRSNRSSDSRLVSLGLFDALRRLTSQDNLYRAGYISRLSRRKMWCVCAQCQQALFMKR